jgi:hypothetical protein
VIILTLFALLIFLSQSLFSPLTQLSARLFDKFNYQEVSINNGVANFDAVKGSLRITNQTADQLAKDQQAPINRNLPMRRNLDEQVVQDNYLILSCRDHHAIAGTTCNAVLLALARVRTKRFHAR